MLVRKLQSTEKENQLPSVATIVARAVAHLRRCTDRTTGRTVTLFDGETVPMPFFSVDNGLCFPQYEEDMTIEHNGAYPPFVLEGVYYPQILKYLQLYPRVREWLWSVFPPLPPPHAYAPALGRPHAFRRTCPPACTHTRCAPAQARTCMHLRARAGPVVRFAKSPTMVVALALVAVAGACVCGGVVQNQVLLLENGDMLRDPQTNMDRVCDFLEISRMTLPLDVQNEIGEACVPCCAVLRCAVLCCVVLCCAAHARV
jgi:hypothetical protein